MMSEITDLNSLTSSRSHSGLMPPSVSVVVLPALSVSNLFLVFSSVGVRFFARLWELSTTLLGPVETIQIQTKCDDKDIYGKYLTNNLY